MSGFFCDYLLLKNEHYIKEYVRCGHYSIPKISLSICLTISGVKSFFRLLFRLQRFSILFYKRNVLEDIYQRINFRGWSVLIVINIRRNFIHHFSGEINQFFAKAIFVMFCIKSLFISVVFLFPIK